MSENPNPLYADFTQTLDDCRQTYGTAATEYTREAHAANRRSLIEAADWMDELHRGLLIKVYLEVAIADHRWSREEQKLAQILIEHLWGRRLTGTALRDAIKGLRDRSRQLSLRSTVSPFLEKSCLRHHLSELSTIIMRLANLVAKSDGDLRPSESHALHKMQETFDRMLTETESTLGLNQEETTPGIAVSVTSDPSSGPTNSPTPIEPQPTRSLDESLETLDALIGLDRVKAEVRTLVNYLRIQRQREKSGLPKTAVSLHLVFNGNPGTGKTTVARIVGEIYDALGVLQQGHLVETDRSGLVAEYAGQTATKTNSKIDEALDGVLFIDEAYSLVAEDGEDAFGREAMQTLLKRMEDDRDRLAVILAGYPAPMNTLLQSNPGLSSRFGRTLEFDDYDAVRLAMIFERLCEQHRYELSWQIRHRLLVAFQSLFDLRDKHFGNGRLVRNQFEDAIRHLSNRIVDKAPLTHELLTQFHPEDLLFDNVTKEVWQRFPPHTTRLQTCCSGCERVMTLKAQYLGRSMKCPRCDAVFPVKWGDLVKPEQTTTE